MFELFANLIAFHLDAHERLTVSESSLHRERQDAELREQFIAVLGHDLRNPLAAVDAGSEVLLRMPLDEKATAVTRRIKRSAARMAALIENLLDFARGRLGGGLPLTPAVATDLELTLEHVIAELESAWPARVVHREFALRRPVVCDSARVAQLLSNLLANALTHGDPDSPVRVYASSDDHCFELSVANLGEPIPPTILEHLFKPFSRASTRSGQQGLGLGLYIASEIAQAHGGSMVASSTPEETRFTFRMPLTA
jgi:signal transduction histidine kinase